MGKQHAYLLIATSLLAACSTQPVSNSEATSLRRRCIRSFARAHCERDKDVSNRDW